MVSLQVLTASLPPHHEQTVTVRQRDMVGSLRVFAAEKQDEVVVSSLTNKRLYLRHPSGNGIWLDNSNVFSSYAINPNKVRKEKKVGMREMEKKMLLILLLQDVLELRQIETPLPSTNHHKSCLKLIIPYYDYGSVSLLYSIK
jgi:hypothetical protein